MIGNNRIKLKVQFKLGLTFFLSFIIPIVVFGIFILISINGILENNLYTHQEMSVDQLRNELDRYLIDLHRISRSLSYNITFTIKLAEQNFTEADNTIVGSIRHEPSITGYYMVTDKGDFFSSPDLQQISPDSIIDETSFRELTEGRTLLLLYRCPREQILRSEDRDTLLCATQINLTYLKEKRIGKGILIFFIDRFFLDELIFQHSDYPNPVYLFNANGNFIYSRNKEVTYKTLPSSITEKLSSQKTGRAKLKSGSENYLVSFTTSRFNSLKIFGFTSDSRIRDDIYFLTKSTLIFLALLIIVFIFFIILLSLSISKPVYNLQRVMKRIEDSNYNSTEDLLYKRNKGILSPYFDDLYIFLHSVIFRINDFHRKEKEHELMILQSQINPHFVYNTLNTIRIMAEKEGMSRLSQAVRALIHLLKKSIRIGTIFISIRDEVTQIKDYISLQSLRYNDSFIVEYNIDETLYDFKCIKFTLQPIVENAIFHGIDTESRNGVITISIIRKMDFIVYTISDNGSGMDPEQFEYIISEQNSNNTGGKIGLQNVNSRLITYFGEDSRLAITSKKNEGTTVTYKIPAEHHES